MEMFSNLSSLLNNLDNAAKETLEEPKESATLIRSRRKNDSSAKLSSDETEDQVSYCCDTPTTDAEESVDLEIV
jgi:hypothetical protein